MKEEFSELFQLMIRARKAAISSYRNFAQEIGMSDNTVRRIEGGSNNLLKYLLGLREVMDKEVYKRLIHKPLGIED